MAESKQPKAAAKPAENPNAAAQAAEIEELKRKLAAAEAKLETRAATSSLSEDDEALINAKVEAGLPRAQAIEVLRLQKRRDAEVAEEAAAAAKK